MIRDTQQMFVTEWSISDPVSAVEQERHERIGLPPPRMQGGGPLMDALKDRASCRSFRSQPLPQELLSDLLWSAFGVNRPAIHGRTAPSADNWQEIAIYVAKADGLFVYQPADHGLLRLGTTDIRPQSGLQPYAGGESPLDLVYVADFARAADVPEEDRRLYCAANTGFIAENVYLFCASERIGTVVRGAIDRPRLAAAMSLRRNERVILAQSVGYPSASSEKATSERGPAH
jgi:nitroreductase